MVVLVNTASIIPKGGIGDAKTQSEEVDRPGVAGIERTARDGRERTTKGVSECKLSIQDC